MKLNKSDLDTHIEEERGTYEDLLEACIKNKISDLETMYEHGNNIQAISESDTSKNTLLHIAVMHGSMDVAKFLIDHDIDVDVRNKNNETPLHHAVSIKDVNKATEIVELLLYQNADPLAKDSLGDTPMSKAQRIGKSSIALLFAETSDRLPTPSVGLRL